MGLRQRYQKSVTLDGTGSGSVTIVPRTPVTVSKYISVVRNPATQQPATGGCVALVDINGFVIDTTRAGHLATSETEEPLSPSDQLTCKWFGGLAGGIATFYVTSTED